MEKILSNLHGSSRGGDVLIEVSENTRLVFASKDEIPLHKSFTRAPCCEEWKYRSIVEIMLYLEESKNPDVAYDVYVYDYFMILSVVMKLDSSIYLDI